MNRPLPPLPPDSCSVGWAGLSAFGTAPQASFWVALEQPGPWGRDAFTQSHLDADIGSRLESLAAAHGGRALLIRAPGHHTDAHSGPRRVLVAGGLSGAAWLLGGQIEDPAQILDLPWDRLAATRPIQIPGLAPEPPALLVCTNAKRDRCCALTGRPLVAALAQEGRRVWECSHSSGHRFAATAVLLPYGQILARLTPGLAGEVLDAAERGRFAIGALNETHDRGVSWLPPREQAAVSWVRAQEGVTEIAGVTALDSGEVVTVASSAGARWDVRVTERIGESLAESCGKPGRPSHAFLVGRA